MSFAFRRLVLKDWLVYAGTVTLDFPPFAPGRNLIVVHGMNGYGKTSLQQALRYVFKERKPKRSKDDCLALWHEGSHHPAGGSFEVSLEFTHQNRQCKIVRGCDFTSRSTGLSHSERVSLFFDGQRQDHQVEDKIQELLPRDCLDFIFFDGAEIVRYAQRRNDKETREAIEKILGIPAVRNLRDDLSKVIKDLESDQQKLLQESQEARNLVGELEAIEDELENYTGARRELSEKLRSLKTLRQELLGDREKIQAVAKDLELLQNKERQRGNLEEQIEEIDTEMQSLTAHLPLLMLEEPLREVYEERRAQEQVSPRIQNLDARLRTLRELVEDSDCLCGRTIDASVRQVLQEQIAELDVKLGRSGRASSRPSEELSRLGDLVRAVQNRRFNPDALMGRRSTLTVRLEEVQTEIGHLQQELKGHPNVDVAEISQQIGQTDERIKDLERRIESIEKNAQKRAADLTEKKRELDRLGAADSQAQGVTRILSEAKRAHSAIAEVVDRLVDQKRVSIEEHATQTFRELTNKPEEYEGLRLRPDYSLEVVRKDGTIVENQRLSAGEKEVVAYSFITALNLSSADPAPFVMDTPFGHLDSEHRRALLESLPNLQVQAFLLATDRDLPTGERDAVERFIAKEYLLKRDPQKAATFVTEDLS